MLKYTDNYNKIYGSFIMANLKEIQRTERIEFLVSKEEKELIWKYAETVKTYKKYCFITSRK